jgi:hypothetical protein
VKKVHLAVVISISILGASMTPARADDLVSLDDPAPSGQSLESLDSLDEPAAESGDAEVALDIGSADSFNPYSFARTRAWAFLPIAAFMLVGLHLLRVPKRKSKRKIDQARRFFRGISGEGTNSSIVTPAKQESK